MAQVLQLCDLVSVGKRHDLKKQQRTVSPLFVERYGPLSVFSPSSPLFFFRCSFHLSPHFLHPGFFSLDSRSLLAILSALPPLLPF